MSLSILKFSLANSAGSVASVAFDFTFDLIADTLAGGIDAFAGGAVITSVMLGVVDISGVEDQDVEVTGF